MTLAAVSDNLVIERARVRGRSPPDREGNGMSRHEKDDDKKRYEGNGHDPRRPVPQKDPGGKHGKPDADDEDDEDTKK